MDILFINPNGYGTYLPVVPPDFEISSNADFEEVQTLSGIKTLPINRQLKTLSISSVIPHKKYSWVNKNSNRLGQNCIDYFQNALDSLFIMKLYCIDKKGKTVLYMPCYIESFTYSVDKVGDYTYSLTVKEYGL